MSDTPTTRRRHAPSSTPKSAPDDRATAGPLDETEANAVRPYVDLGGVKILPRAGLQLRLEVEEGSKRVVAVGLDYAGSTLQVQPFAAPRSSGLWHEIREQIVEQIATQGGTTDGARGRLRPRAARRDPRARRRLSRAHAPRPVHRRRRPALVPARRHRGEAAVDPTAARADRGPVPQHRRGARQHADAAARPHPAAHARRQPGSPRETGVDAGDDLADRRTREPDEPDRAERDRRSASAFAAAGAEAPASARSTPRRGPDAAAPCWRRSAASAGSSRRSCPGSCSSSSTRSRTSCCCRCSRRSPSRSCFVAVARDRHKRQPCCRRSPALSASRHLRRSRSDRQRRGQLPARLRHQRGIVLVVLLISLLVRLAAHRRDRRPAHGRRAAGVHDRQAPGRLRRDRAVVGAVRAPPGGAGAAVPRRHAEALAAHQAADGRAALRSGCSGSPGSLVRARVPGDPRSEDVIELS